MRTPQIPASKRSDFSSMLDIDRLSQKLLKLETKLNSNIPSTLWISDLHGEGDRFKSILRGRFGMLYRTCIEALPKTFSVKKIQLLVRIIRKQAYVHDDDITLDMQDVIMSLVQILKYKLSNIDRHLDELLLPEFRETVRRLISGLPVPDPVYEERIISSRLIFHLARTIKLVLLDHIMVLGDIFDRGSQPDKIIRFLSSRPYRNIVDFVFGNHDILWMGAAAGNRSLIAEAMRITCRYDHFDLLRRLGFDTRKLEEFSRNVYPPEKATGTFKAKTAPARCMEKALAIMQFKLEEQTILNHPEFEMESRLWLSRLADLLKRGDTDSLSDIHFPTVDLNSPQELTREEKGVMDDLEKQFVSNRKLKRLLRYFFRYGETYKIHHDILNVHALIPSTKDGEFDEFLDRRGKELLDHIQKTIRKIGRAYLSNRKQSERDLALMFYLWCGPKSPFFGKEAMKTFERYFCREASSHKERTLYWAANLRSDRFKRKIMEEFGIGKVVFGHTPVDVTKGYNMASRDGIAINIDGGFAAAYYNRGHALVQTPFQLYGIILPTPEEIEQASLSSDTVPLSVEIIERFSDPVKVKDTSSAKVLWEKRDELLEELGKRSPVHQW